jgi:MATE family multidrug resistance protein
LGQLNSPLYLASAGLGAIIMSYILFSFGFIKSTTTGYISQFDNLGNDKKITTIHQIIIISALISFLLLFFKDALVRYSLSILGEPGAIDDNAAVYLDIRFWSIPAIFLRDIFIGYLIGIKRVSTAMKIIITINLLNIILDYYFVFILNMNIEGVAYASLISESSIIIFIIIFLINDRGFLNKRIFKESVSSFTSLKNKLLVNGNMFIRSVILMTCFAHFMSLSADYGEIVLAANTILLNFFFIFSYGIDAFAHASEVMVGNSVGEKNVQKYDFVVRSSFKFTLLIALIFLSIFIIFSSNIFSLITSHIDVIQKAEQNFFFLLLVIIFGSIAFCIDGILIGGLQHQLMRNIMIISGLVYFSSIYFLHPNIGSLMWCPFILFFLTRSILLFLHLNHTRRVLFS